MLTMYCYFVSLMWSRIQHWQNQAGIRVKNQVSPEHSTAGPITSVSDAESPAVRARW